MSHRSPTTSAIVIAASCSLAGCGPAVTDHAPHKRFFGATNLPGDVDAHVAVTACIEEMCSTEILEVAPRVANPAHESVSLEELGVPVTVSLSKLPAEATWQYAVEVDLVHVDEPIDLHWTIHDLTADVAVMSATFRNLVKNQGGFRGTRLDVAATGDEAP